MTVGPLCGEIGGLEGVALIAGIARHTPPCLAQSETFVKDITQTNIRYRTVTPRPALMVYVNAGHMYVPLTNKAPCPLSSSIYAGPQIRTCVRFIEYSFE